MTLTSAFYFFPTILLFLSCSTQETEKIDVMHLQDIWALDSIHGEKVVIDDSIKNLPMIEIYVKEERVHGNTSCNSFDGKVDIDENQISFSNIISTEMACPGNLEQRFLAAIQSVDNYNIEKLRLYLYEGEVEKITFRKID